MSSADFFPSLLSVKVNGRVTNDREQYASKCIHLVDCPPFLTRETIIGTSCLLTCIPVPFWKGIYSKRKEFVPIVSKFFPFRIDPFSEGNKCNSDSAVPWKCISFPLRQNQPKNVDITLLLASAINTFSLSLSLSLFFFFFFFFPHGAKWKF